MEEKKLDDALNQASDIEEKTENKIEEAEAEVADVENKLEEAEANVADAEEKIEDAAEAEEKIDEIKADADTEIKEASETVSEIKEGSEDTAEKDYDPSVLKGKAPNSSPIEVKKGRKPLNKTNVIVIVVCAVVVIAAVLFTGFKVGWFDFLKNTNGSLDLADLSRIEVYKEDVEVTDDTIESYVDSVLSSQATTETLDKGKVEMGDTANIDYKGVRKDTGEAFEGGTDEGYALAIGSGTFIEGFEEGVVGMSVGEEKDIDLTFPEDYQEESLAGQDVTFTVKVNSIDRTTTPELTDEWVKEYSAKYCPETYNTVDEFRAYAKDTVVNYYLNQAIYQSIADKSTIKAYNQEDEQMLMDYNNEQLASYASMYGVEPDYYATMMGYNDAEEYNKEIAHQYLDIQMIVDEIFKKQNLSYTDEEVNEDILQYMKDNRYVDTYATPEEFLESLGATKDTWMWLFTNLEFKFTKAMESLKDNVVVLEEKPTTEEDTAIDIGAIEDEALDEEVELEEAVEDNEAETVVEEAETAE